MESRGETAHRSTQLLWKKLLFDKKKASKQGKLLATSPLRLGNSEVEGAELKWRAEVDGEGQGCCPEGTEYGEVGRERPLRILGSW